MNNLYEASRQWADRPNDERYWTIQEAFKTASYHKDNSRTVDVTLNQLECKAGNYEIILNGNTEASTLTHHGFNDLCRNIGAPASYLRTLPAELVAENIQVGLNKSEKQGQFLLRAVENGVPKIRCFNSEIYDRIWDRDVLIRLLHLETNGWKTPPARPAKNDPRARKATDLDVINSKHGSLGIKEGDLISPAGIYVSDHDMFVFMIFDGCPINDGSGQPVYRGFFVSNSEVPGKAFKVTMFLYRSVCGNHIVWDVSDVSELKIIHKGKANERFTNEMSLELSSYANASAYNTEQKIKNAQTKLIATDKEKVLDFIFGKKLLGKKEAESAYDYAVIEADTTNAGSPNSYWGFAQGLTAYSQTRPYADERVELDRVSGKILEMSQ